MQWLWTCNNERPNMVLGSIRLVIKLKEQINLCRLNLGSLHQIVTKTDEEDKLCGK